MRYQDKLVLALNLVRSTMEVPGCIVQGADYDVFCRRTTLETHITAMAENVNNLSPLGNTLVILM